MKQGKPGRTAFVRFVGITLAIAVGLLGLLVLIALMVRPHLGWVGLTAEEATLQGELHEFREAIKRFEVDMGDYPARLSDLMATTAPAGRGGRGRKLTPSGFRGPYLNLLTPDGRLPVDPYTHSNTTWVYSPATGKIRSGAPGKALSGEPLSSW
jgi:hypothetical protein